MGKFIMQAVNSTNIRKVGFDKDTNTMIVSFIKGDDYTYTPVTHGRYLTLLTEDSIGKAFLAGFRNDKSLTVKKYTNG